MRRMANRAFAKRVAAGALFVAASCVYAAPQAAAQSATSFAPLAQWRKAVLSGDQTGLANLYLHGPGPAGPGGGETGLKYKLLENNHKMFDGRLPTPASAEAPFWAGLKAQGLVAMDPKILEEESPQSGTIFLVLRVELTFAAKQGDKPRQQVIAMRQTWVNIADLGPPAWAIAATRRDPAEPMEAISLPQPATPDPHLYPAPGDAQTALDEALALARADHKRVLVIFGATWCYDCHVLDATLRSPQVAPLVAANYHVIHINIGDGDDNADLAARFEVPLDKGIPGLAVLDPDGRLVTSQKNGEFESAARIGMQDVTGFLERWKPASNPR